MKKLKIVLIFMIIVISCNFSFANFDMGQMSKNNQSTTNTKNDSLVYASSEEVTINSEFYLIINLSKINYTKFNVKIITSSQVALNEIPEGVSNVYANDNIVSFNVNKNDIALEKLAITYDSLAQEGTIDFDITITSLDDNITTWKKEISALETEIEELNTQLIELEEQLSELEKESEPEKSDTENITNTNNTDNIENTTTNTTVDTNETEDDTESYKKLQKQIETVKDSISTKEQKITELEEKIKSNVEEVLTGKAIIKVVEELNDKKVLDKEENEKMENMISTMKKMMGQVEKLEGNLKTANKTISSLTTTVTYQGSQNNYLESLSISGVEFKNAFKKTTQTYFATVDSSIEDVAVNAVAEDSSAIVTVYGNNNLVSGKNKILVNVTADDGNCRTYKIYVTK